MWNAYHGSAIHPIAFRVSLILASSLKGTQGDFNTAGLTKTAMLQRFLVSFILLAAIVLLHHSKSDAANPIQVNPQAAELTSSTGNKSESFTISNGYFQLSGSAGLINDFRLDALGQGQYASNTIADSGHLGYLIDGTLLTSQGAVATIQGNQIVVTGLPQGTILTVTLNGNIMTERLTFSGAHTIRHEWDLVYLDDGFYQRATGQNYNPNQTLEMPFESFYNTANGSYRPVEHFKKSAAQLLSLGWTRTYCRGRLVNDVIFNCSHAPTNVLPQTSKLTLVNEGRAGSSASTTFKVLPKSYSTSLDGNKPLPEFYVRPDVSINALSDPAVTYNASSLLTELFQHSVFWYGPNAGIWSDWSMRAGSFMNNSYRDGLLNGIMNWVIGDDGYGHYGLAYVWGSERGWPFPGGKDTRHFNTNAIYIAAIWRYAMWSGDKSFLLSGTGDQVILVDYGNGNIVQSPPPASISIPAQLTSGSTLGQTFTATAPFTRVASQNPTWAMTDSSFTLTLYTHPGGTVITSKVFTHCVDNAFNYLSFPQQPAGPYYLEMSQGSGMIGWWGSATDAYTGGQAYKDGHPVQNIIDRCRTLMNYQQETLLGATQNLLVLGSNTGSTDHGARHATDVGSNYYDILPFGYKDAYTNAEYYLCLRAMADLEDYMDNHSMAKYYSDQLRLVRQKYNQTFWRTNLDRDGSNRYIGCVDVNGVDHDFGFTFINTKAIEAGLTDDYPDRIESIFRWLDFGESQHSNATRNNVVRIMYVGANPEWIPDPNKGSTSANQLQPGAKLKQNFYARAPFNAIASYNPTWNTSNSSFTLTLYRQTTGQLIANKTFHNVSDNSLNELDFDEQQAGFYTLEMSNAVGTVGWWSCPWVPDIYGRWLFAPRVTTRYNTTWWAYPIGTAAGPTYNPGDPNFMWRWDIQLQNGGADLYESGFDVITRARYYDPDNAWERLQTILRRYVDPDRLCSKKIGFYGESIQGDGSAGSVGWMRSEFPETCVLGAAFFLGFFGIDPAPDGLHITPHIPSGHGITALGARNIEYQGATFDIEITSDSVKIICTRNQQNKKFYMTNGISENGLFNKVVPLQNGSMVLSLKPQQPFSSIRSVEEYYK